VKIGWKHIDEKPFELNYQDKIHNLVSGKEQIALLKQKSMKIVFTNGCFDIMHLGHITYLEEARRLGDFLVVGLNSDASVRKLKGEGRPVKQIQSRVAVLAGLAAVDMVIIFDQDTPLNLIQNLMPDILVKGGDYKIEDIVGADSVLENGGSVRVIDFVSGYSSSAIIDKMESE